MVVDRDVGFKPEGVDGTEAGLCFFADNEIDRHPTGSCVTVRMALAHAKNLRSVGQK
jgi:proline racemase